MEEIEKLKSSMVTKESHELLQRELKATKEAFENYKKENNKKLLELMKEVSHIIHIQYLAIAWLNK